MSQEARNQAPSTDGRMAIFDVVRGFSVISMVAFHLCYDLRFIYGFDLDFFRPPLQDVWRASISWTFLFVAGCMCSFSRSGWKRAARYLVAAAAVWVVTTVVSVDTPISFGIIFCMGASTLLQELLYRMGFKPEGWMPALLLLVAFLLLRGVPHGTVGIGSLSVRLPRWLYATPWLSWLGFPGPGFASGDYYPVLPFFLMYLVGACMGRHWKSVGYPAWFHRVSCRPLQFAGRHALPVYLLHQPLIMLVLELLP